MSETLPVLELRPTAEPDRFVLVVANRSERPLTLWRDGCSWGHGALTLRLTDRKTGGRRVLRRRPMVWKRNAPAPLPLEPGQQIERELSLSLRDWEGFGMALRGREFLMEAILSIPRDPFADRFGVWTGTAVSSTIPACPF